VARAAAGRLPHHDREFGVRGFFFILRTDRGQLIKIARLIDGGTVRPVIGSVFPLAGTREALGQGLGGRPGKVVLRVVE
jgi:NADPH:quinone reductase-like Zn-dependent oxidoreductase